MRNSFYKEKWHLANLRKEPNGLASHCGILYSVFTPGITSMPEFFKALDDSRRCKKCAAAYAELRARDAKERAAPANQLWPGPLDPDRHCMKCGLERCRCPEADEFLDGEWE